MSLNRPIARIWKKKQMPLSAFFYNIVVGNLLPGASILTTSRPSAVEEVTDLSFDKSLKFLALHPNNCKLKNTWRTLQKIP